MKNVGYVVGILVAVVVLFFGMAVVTSNNVIAMEEQIFSVQSDVEIQEQRRIDLILGLVEVVEQAGQYESETLSSITSMRSFGESGDVESAMGMLNVVVEAYPELRANEAYLNLMNEMSVTENMLAEHRKTVNNSVEAYRRSVRKFPTKMFLNVMGYEVIDFDYLEFGNTEMPDSLFGDN